MSTAICIACGSEVRWRASRGARLAEIRCKCGGELTAKRGVRIFDRPTYAARLVLIRRFEQGRKTKYFVSAEAARKRREEALPFYESVILQLKNEHGWVPAHD